MWIAKIDANYTARHSGTRMEFFYKQEFQCELEIKTNKQARKMLDDWARLKIPPSQVKRYQELIQDYIGATVDDITVGEGGEYHINGKPVGVI